MSGWHWTKATASASVSRTCFVVRVRRSPRWSISCAISCTSVENFSAGCIPERRVIFPPKEGKDLPALTEVEGDVSGYRERLVKFVEGQNVTLNYSERIAPAKGLSH